MVNRWLQAKLIAQSRVNDGNCATKNAWEKKWDKAGS